MAYKKVGWKNYPSTETPISATNLEHMDAGILENSQTIGDKSKISELGDGTVAGAIAANKAAIDANTQSLTELNTFENISILTGYFTVLVKLLDSRAYREGNHVRMEVRFNLEEQLPYTIPLFYIDSKFAPKTKIDINVGSIDLTQSSYVTQYVCVKGRLDSTGYYVFTQNATENLQPGSYYVSIDYSLLA